MSSLKIKNGGIFNNSNRQSLSKSCYETPLCLPFTREITIELTNLLNYGGNKLEKKYYLNKILLIKYLVSL